MSISPPADVPTRVPGTTTHENPGGVSAAGSELASEVRSLVPLVRADAPKAEQLGALTPEVVQALSSAGLFRMTVPVEFGGLALGARDHVEVISALSEGDGSAGWLGFVAAGLRMIPVFPDRAVDEVFAGLNTWIGPLAAGASIFSTTVGDARRVDGGWQVNGVWPFGSGSRHAAWGIVGVGYDAAHGSGRGLVLLERKQFEILDDWHVMGLSATSSNTLRIKDEMFVPDHRFVDMAQLPERMAAVRRRFQGAAFRQGTRGQLLAVCLSNVAIALGMARGALSCFVEQAGSRKPFNLPYPSVAEMASTQVSAGKASAMINTAGVLIEHHAVEVDRRAMAAEDFSAPEESGMTMELAYAANLCADAIRQLQTTLGSATVALKNPIQRFARDAFVLTTHGAIRLDPLAEINGRQLLGLPPFPMFAGGLPDRGRRD